MSIAVSVCILISSLFLHLLNPDIMSSMSLLLDFISLNKDFNPKSLVSTAKEISCSSLSSDFVVFVESVEGFDGEHGRHTYS